MRGCAKLPPPPDLGGMQCRPVRIAPLASYSRLSNNSNSLKPQLVGTYSWLNDIVQQWSDTAYARPGPNMLSPIVPQIVGCKTERGIVGVFIIFLRRAYWGLLAYCGVEMAAWVFFYSFLQAALQVFQQPASLSCHLCCRHSSRAACCHCLQEKLKGHLMPVRHKHARLQFEKQSLPKYKLCYVRPFKQWHGVPWDAFTKERMQAPLVWSEGKLTASNRYTRKVSTVFILTSFLWLWFWTIQLTVLSCPYELKALS